VGFNGCLSQPTGRKTVSNAIRFTLPLAAMLLALAGCASVGKQNPLHIYSDQAEVDKGSETHTRIVKYSGLYQGEDLSGYVAAVGSKIASMSDRPTLEWHFTVLDSGIPNAYATRGGYVYITRGMIATLRSENDLAAVLAHEIAHISTRDALRSDTNGSIIGVGTLAVAVATAPVALLFPYMTFAPGAAGMAAMARSAELNADRNGAEYLRRAGYPPESMSAALDIVRGVEAFQRDQQKSGVRGSEWSWSHRIFADHPSPDKRRAHVGDGQSSGSTAPDPEFLARLEGIELGSTKQEGIPYGRKRYFPQWDVALEVPEGWKASASSTNLRVFREDHKGSMRLESVGTGGTGDLCETLGSLAKDRLPFPSRSGDGVRLSELERSREDGVRSCKGIAHHSSKSVFGEKIVRVGIVAPDAMPGALFFYREYRNAETDDPIFVSIARSIEALGETPARPTLPTVHIHKVQEGDTFASLAKAARGIPNAEGVLRLINQRYPRGEPKPGELVKVIE
jgi:predicted Zn-dependent protease